MKKFLVRTMLGALMALALPSAFAGDVTVSWTPPPTCADGSPISGCPISGYEVASGTSATQTTFTPVENVGPAVLTKTYSSVAPGTTRCYSLKTLTGAGVDRLKSDESQRSCATVPYLPPKAPGGITVTVSVTVAAPQ